MNPNFYLKLLVSFGLLFCSFDTAAQVAVQWDKTFGGLISDRFQSLCTAKDGGYLLAGYSQSGASDDKSEDSKGVYDYWVVKIDAKGKKQWDRTIGGNSYDWLRRAIPTSDGGFLLGGYSSSGASGDKSENGKGGLDYWVVKIDAQGNKQWDKTLGGSKLDWLESAIATPDGGYLLGGYSDSNTSGDKSQQKIGKYDYWVVKIDAQGKKQWDKTIGGRGNDELHNTIVTPDGGYLLLGSSNSPASGDKKDGSKGDLDFWVVKTNDKGKKVWDKTIGGKGYEVPTSAVSNL